MQRILRSDDLPQPAMGERGATLRDQATAGTVVLPDIREVEVGGWPVLVTRLASGEVIAFQTHCPHQGTPLRKATIYGGLVRCEQHKFVYDPATGRNVLPSRDASPQALHRLKPGFLRTWPVEERDGWIWISEEPNPPPTGDEPLPGVEVHRPPSRPSRPPTSREPATAAPRRLTVTVGVEFELPLPTSPQPNHIWQVTAEPDVLEVLGQRYEDSPEGVTHLVRAVARQPGEIAVRCAYRKPWGSAARAEHRFTLTAEAS